MELARQLAVELQAALDQLKPRTLPNFKLIKPIRDEVTGAEWLKTKEAQRVSELPVSVEAPATDVIAQLYNAVRPEIGTSLNLTRNLAVRLGLERKLR